MSLQEYRPLIVRASRTLGSVLLEKQLVTAEQLDEANEKFLANLEQGDLRRASILHVLLFEMQVLKEDAFIEATVEKYGLGLIDLHGCQFRKFSELQPITDACWVTWTVPFDVLDDFYLLASLMYPSPPVVKFWQEKFPGKNLLWYATSVRSFQSAMEKLEQLKGEAARAAAVAAARTSTPKTTKPPLPAKK
ncbi:MAG TPA: hypothetical protein VHC95_01820 [Opitutales bacterium]|nr:hypothetical protein [Opitutales bacterium]